MPVEPLIVFFATAVCSALLVALILWLSHQKSWYDRTSERKVHTGDIPRLGGVGFAFIFVIAAVIIVVMARKMDLIIRFLPCLVGVCIVVSLGVWDDFRPLKPRTKLLIQILAALCVIIPGFVFRRIVYFGGTRLEHLPWLGYSITLLWIVGLTNAMNLIDGIDGLAGGLSIVIALTYGLIFMQFAETPSAAMVCICMVGSVAGFLVFNAPVPKAKIFMGDGGSQFLGFTLALLPLLEEHDTVASLPLFHATALLLIPIFDTFAAIWRRLRDRQPVFSPDRAHIHHKLMNIGLSTRKIDATLLSLQVVLCALVFASMKAVQGWLSVGILGIAYILAIVFFAAVHFLNRRMNLPGRQKPSLI